MRKKLAGVLLVLAASGWLDPAAATELGTIEVKISFEFVAGGETLPSGRYTIRQPDASVDRLVITGDKDDARTEVPFEPLAKAYPAYQTQLVFDKIGSRHYLLQVWIEDESTGRLVVRDESPEEAAMPRERKTISAKHSP